MWTLVFFCSLIASCGVQGYWETIEGGTVLETPASTNAPCGGYLYDSNGTFYSPNYPNNYPNSAACTWYIRPGQQIVQLDFSYVNIEHHSACAFDAINVYDGSSSSSRLLGTVCGTVPNTTTFYSTGADLIVFFRSDSSFTNSGFRADYRIVSTGSCRYNCGYQVGKCSCSSDCEYRGNCCPDYLDYCPTSTVVSETTEPTNAPCGGYLYDSNGTFYSPNYPNNYPNSAACTWYIRPGQQIVQLDFSYVNIENNSACAFDAINVYDGSSSSSRLLGTVCGTVPNTTTFYSTGADLTVFFRSDLSVTYSGFRADYRIVSSGSCRYNCGYQVGNCSCSSDCEYRGNCCPDYLDFCPTSTVGPPTSDQPSCRYNCGYNMGSCSCSSSCQYNGNCCHDYYNYCYFTTESPVSPTTDQPSCRYNCGYHMGSCSCSSSCQYYGNCCHDYYNYCDSTTQSTVRPTTDQPSCLYNCGYHMGSCSCSSSCEYYGNCCHDYYNYCYFTTESPVSPTTDQPSCRYNCGYHMGSCSCSSSCEYYGNCCHDYYSYCGSTTDIPTTAAPCGGYLFGSGTFTSPNHPSYYHDNAYCIWQLRAADDQRIFLQFTYLQLENCCSCDYIEVYNGPSVGSQFLGKVCNGNLTSFYSSSKYMTVRFRTDGSVVGRGFKAEFLSSLPPDSGRVECSSDNMNIVIGKSYLDSLGYSGHNLYLNDPNCRPQVSSYQVVFRFPINSCGNIQKFENGSVVYTNAVRAYPSSYGEITRQSFLKLNVGCHMDQDSVSQIMYIARHHDNGTIVGTGQFNTSMRFYTSSSFYYEVTQFPYEVMLNQNLYIQVTLSRSDSRLVLFLDTCVASPTPYDFNTRAYYLVRNGCATDSTYYAYTTGTRPYARFRFRAFQFLRATESVYIQCKVLICQASDYNSRCRRGCSRRATRDLGSEHDSQTLVLGPIQLKDTEKKEEGTHEQDKA
uniref:deleted in malignant brain tumors 1 protein isoform X4 n=1 Tax=Scatophagus argus TaxID=75038 RepID=UPI001ED82D9E|nr:deleted in malignant brain tumors 1 protein isoform X4 [Scatophagus argus]